MKEYRCKFCHKLLFRWNPIKENFENEEHEGLPLIRTSDEQLQRGYFEVKCPKCKKTTKYLSMLPLAFARREDGTIKIS